MNTYVTLGGRAIEYPDPPAALAAFLARVRAAAADDSVGPDAMLLLAYGPENPLLDTTLVPGRAVVTAAAFEHPVYHVVADLLAVKDVRLGRLDLAAAHAAYTVGLAEAAAQLGMSRQGVRVAIDAHRLAAVVKGGHWFTCPAAVAAFRLSKAGRPKKAASAGPAGLTVRGGSAGGLSLQVKVEGAELAIGVRDGTAFDAHAPGGWSRAVVKLTTKRPTPGVRVVVLEPATAGDTVRLEHGDLSVEGRFVVAERVNNAKAANAAWRAAGQPVAAP